MNGAQPTRGALVELAAPGAGAVERLWALSIGEPRPILAGRITERLPFSPAEAPPGPMLVRDRVSGEEYGIVAGFRIPEQEAVDVSVFLDPRRSPPGVGVEAYLLYMRRLVEHGSACLRLIVYEGDWIALRMVKRLGLSAQARLREHIWLGGGWRDVLLFAVPAADFPVLEARMSELLYVRPGTRR